MERLMEVGISLVVVGSLVKLFSLLPLRIEVAMMVILIRTQ